MRTNLFILIVLALLGTACTGSSTSSNQATLSVQINRSQQLATRLANKLQSTSLATDLQLTATAQSIQSTLLAVRNWEIVLPGNFDLTSNAWVLGEDSNEYGSSKWTITSGKLRWDASATQGLVWWSIPDMPVVTDFFISVIAQQIDAPTDSLVGLAFRVTEDEEGYYLFQIDPTGNFSVYQLNNDNWISLVSWRPATEFLPGQTNELAVLGQGSTFHFFINEKLVGTMQDDYLASGSAGLVIGLDNPGDTGSWEFESFQVSAPAGTFTPATSNP